MPNKTKSKPPVPPGKSVNAKSSVVAIRLCHPARAEAARRAKVKGFNDIGSYLRHLLEAYFLGGIQG